MYESKEQTVKFFKKKEDSIHFNTVCAATAVKPNQPENNLY
jgi:hypothetical protein